KVLSARHRTVTRRGWVAGINLHLRDRTTLNAFRRTRRALRIRIGMEVTIVARVGIDEATDGAVFVSQLRLQSAPATAVTDDHDLALDADAKPREFLVIVGHAV